MVTQVTAPPGIRSAVVCNGLYPKPEIILAPNAVIDPLQIWFPQPRFPPQRATLT